MAILDSACNSNLKALRRLREGSTLGLLGMSVASAGMIALSGHAGFAVLIAVAGIAAMIVIERLIGRQIEVWGDDAGLLLVRRNGDSERVAWSDVEGIDFRSRVIRFRRSALGKRSVRFLLPGAYDMRCSVESWLHDRAAMRSGTR